MSKKNNSLEVRCAELHTNNAKKASALAGDPAVQAELMEACERLASAELLSAFEDSPEVRQALLNARAKVAELEAVTPFVREHQAGAAGRLMALFYAESC